MAILRIKKRDSQVVTFEKGKIQNAISKAFTATHTKDHGDSERLANQVAYILERKFGHETPSVEDVQDTVEEVLLAANAVKVASAYVLYREKHRQVRIKKGSKEKKEGPQLSLNALKVLQRRYLVRDDDGNIIETPEQLFRRVARAIADVDKKYKEDYQKAEEAFYAMLVNLEFLPNTPTLMNAGVKPELGLAACYVLPVEDSLEGIFTALKYQALIHQGGGGTGFAFSRLRPRNDIVRSSKGTSSGPVSFMRIFDTATDVVKQGGKRRGANMAILRVDHPDILAFVSCKQQKGFLENFNISVGVTEKFMHAVKTNGMHELVNPRTKQVVQKIQAQVVWKEIVENAWRSGDPGLVFLDEMNKHNQVRDVAEIESTNPCGEQPLLPYESCTLGSINLTKFVKKGDVDWDKLAECVERAVHFLDNVIDASMIPIAEVDAVTKANRRIGLGVMGWAEMLILVGMRYDTHEALRFAETLMKFMQDHALKASQELAKARGNFPNFQKSTWKREYAHMRNVAVTTIAPTGSISILAGCSSGVEPLFSVSYVREVMEGTQLVEVNPFFEKMAVEKGFMSAALMRAVAMKGSIQKMRVPKEIKRLFVVAHDIKPEWHVRMQAAFQKFTDNAVSKTINLPENASVKDVEKAYMLAYTLKCKGITVFRYGSKEKQVLYIGKKVDAEFAGGCPTVHCGN